MPANRVHCLVCKSTIPAENSADWMEQDCPACHARQSAVVFPAIRGIFVPPPTAAPAEADGFASCFFHGGKPAATPCDMCGRFLCDLCDLKLDRSHLCALCVQAAQEEKSPTGAKPITQMKDRTFLPQNAAMALAFYLPITLAGLYVIFLSAPAAMYFTIRYWNHPGGIQQRGRWRSVLSLAMASLQVLGLLAAVALVYWTWDKTARKQ